MSNERAIAWAAEFARRLINQSSVNDAWTQLLSALSAIETQISDSYTAAGLAIPFVLLPGKETAVIQGPADRKLDLWLKYE